MTSTYEGRSGRCGVLTVGLVHATLVMRWTSHRVEQVIAMGSQAMAGAASLGWKLDQTTETTSGFLYPQEH